MKEFQSKMNIFLYRLYVVFNEPLFWGPILIVSIQRLTGMSLSDICYMESLTLVIGVFLDIPFGALADIIGRKRTLIAGRIFILFEIFIFATMSKPIHAWIANICWIVGYTLQSGADTSFLYDTLKESGRENEYKSIEGQSVGIRFLIMAFGSLIAGFMANINLRLPLYLCIPFTIIPLISVLFIFEPIKTKKYSIKKQIDVLKQGILFLFKSVKVGFMIGFVTLLSCISKVWFFSYNPYFEVVKIDISYYGLIFFLLNVVAWIASHYAQRIELYIGEENCIIGMILCIGVPLIIMGLVPIQACALLLLVPNIVRGFMGPFVGDYMHRRIDTEIRATTMSVMSTLRSIASIIALTGFGVLVGYVSLLNSLVVLGVITLFSGFCSYVIYKTRVE